MSEDFDDFYDDETPEGMVVCDNCNGDGEVDCHCGGDQCYCGANDGLTCPVCHGEQHITKERWEKRAARHREIMKALWGDPPSADYVPPPRPPQTEGGKGS